MSFIDKSAKKHRSRKEHRSPDDKPLQDAYPAIFDYLTVQESGGESRQTSTMTLCVDGGLFKVFLNDRSCDRYCCSSGSSLASAISLLEAQLVDDSADWRTGKSKGGKRN